MDEPMIWTAGDLVAWTRHQAADVRGWAWRRLLLHHPEAASRTIPERLNDPDVGVAVDAVRARDGRQSRGPSSRRGPPPVRPRRGARGPRAVPESAAPESLEARVEQLTAAPERLRREAPAALGGGAAEDQYTMLSALERQPYRWATALVLDHLDNLLTTDASPYAWEVLAELGDPAVLPLAVAAWRPGERRIAALALRLHRLSSEEEPLSPELVQDAKGHIREADLVSEVIEGDVPLVLDLRCTVCRRTFMYEVGSATLRLHPSRWEDEGWDGVVLGRVIVCKGCGAEDAYELTSAARSQLARLLFAVTAMPRREGVVALAELRLWDGTLVKRPSQALRHLRAFAEQHPEQPAAWRRLGNACARYELLEEAVVAWRRAAEEPREMDACYSLAQHYDGVGQMAEAVEFAQRTIERLRGGRDGQSGEARRAAADAALDIMRGCLDIVGERRALRVTWSTSGAGKGPPVVHVSSVDLERVGRWDRLLELLAGRAFEHAEVTGEMPDEGDTMLARLLESDVPIAAAKAPPRGASAGKAGRNDPCPCGSGKKLKKCCGR